MLSRFLTASAVHGARAQAPLGAGWSWRLARQLSAAAESVVEEGKSAGAAAATGEAGAREGASESIVENTSEQSAAQQADGEKKKVKNPITTPWLAFQTLKEKNKPRKFDETLEFAINLAIDPRKQDQQLRVIADLPHGTGKKVKVVAFTSNAEQAKLAQAAGCEVVGGEELIDEILRTQQVSFDKAVCTPEMLPALAKVARILGPRGLMPSKKLGTVVTEIVPAVQRAKAGSIELRADRAGVVHCGFGKFSMSNEVLLENLKAVLLCIENNKPPGVKGRKWVKSAFITSTMGPSHPINTVYLDPKNPRFMAKE